MDKPRLQESWSAVLCWCNSHDILQRPPSNWQRHPHNWADWYNCAWKYTVVSARVWISWTSLTSAPHWSFIFDWPLYLLCTLHQLSSLLFPRPGGVNLLMGYALRHVTTCQLQSMSFPVHYLHSCCVRLAAKRCLLLYGLFVISKQYSNLCLCVWGWYIEHQMQDWIERRDAYVPSTPLLLQCCEPVFTTSIRDNLYQ